MNETRRQCIRRAYDKIRCGKVCASLDDLAKSYDPTQHPDVTSGRETDEGHYKHFLSLFGATKPDD